MEPLSLSLLTPYRCKVLIEPVLNQTAITTYDAQGKMITRVAGVDADACLQMAIRTTLNIITGTQLPRPEELGYGQQ